MTSKKLCEMCMEYSTTEKCEYKNTCELQKILTETKALKRKIKNLKRKLKS